MPHEGVKHITPENLQALKSIWEINRDNPTRIQNSPIRESLLEKVGLYDSFLGLQEEVLVDYRVHDYEVDIPTTAYGSVENDVISKIEVDHDNKRVTLS